MHPVQAAYISGICRPCIYGAGARDMFKRLIRKLVRHAKWQQKPEM